MNSLIDGKRDELFPERFRNQSNLVLPVDSRQASKASRLPIYKIYNNYTVDSLHVIRLSRSAKAASFLDQTYGMYT